MIVPKEFLHQNLTFSFGTPCTPEKEGGVEHIDGYYIDDRCYDSKDGFVYVICDRCNGLMRTQNETHYQCPFCGETFIDTIGSHLVAWREIAAEMKERLLRGDTGPMTEGEKEFCGGLCDGQVMELFQEVRALRHKLRELSKPPV